MVWGALIGAAAGGGLGALGAIMNNRDATRARRRQRDIINAQQNDPMYRQAKQFLMDSFSNAGTSPLAVDFRKSIDAGQAARGMFAGNAADISAAMNQSGFAQQLRMGMLGQIQSMNQYDTMMRVAAATGAQLPGLGPANLQSSGAAALSGGIAGASAGFGVGSSFSSLMGAQQAPSASAGNDYAAMSSAYGSMAQPAMSAAEEQELRGITGLRASEMYGRLRYKQRNPFDEAY
jgi:hypothetical protein